MACTVFLLLLLCELWLFLVPISFQVQSKDWLSFLKLEQYGIRLFVELSLSEGITTLECWAPVMSKENDFNEVKEITRPSLKVGSNTS